MLPWARTCKSLLEMLPCNLSSGLILHGVVITSPQFICCNGITDSSFCSTLAEFCQVCTAETFRFRCNERYWHVWCDWRLPQCRVQDALSRWKVWQWNVDELIQSSGTQQGLVKEFWTICGANEEDVLLHANTINFCEKLVHDTISGASCISCR